MKLSLDPRHIPPHLAENENCWRAQFALLTANYLRLAELGQTASTELLYRRAITKAEWLTPALLDTTVEWVIEHVDGPLPTVAAFLDYARERAEEQRQQAAAMVRPALPAPPATARLDRAAFARQVAIGILLQRRRQAAIVAWRTAQRAADPTFPKYGPVPRDVYAAIPPLTEVEIAAVVAELQTRQVARMRRRGSVLERAADEVLDALAAGGRLPAANGRGAP